MSYDDSVAESLESMAARLNSPQTPDNFVLGAFDDNLVGMVGFVHKQGQKVQHTGYIWGMYVTREAAGHGIGRALIEQALAEAHRLPAVEQVTLAVVSTNEAARQLYQSLGFKTYGVEPHTLKVGGKYFDEELMMLRWTSDGFGTIA